jgi:hypothetical protein
MGHICRTVRYLCSAIVRTCACFVFLFDTVAVEPTCVIFLSVQLNDTIIKRGGVRDHPEIISVLIYFWLHAITKNALRILVIY